MQILLKLLQTYYPSAKLSQNLLRLMSLGLINSYSVFDEDFLKLNVTLLRLRKTD